MPMQAYDGLLEAVPADPTLALNYSELLALWKEQKSISDNGERQTADAFWTWDRKVQSLLSGRELKFYLEPHLENLVPSDPDIAQVNRLNHLTKILVYRQGIKTTNGFNG
jgi:hypothetical protein